MRTYTVHRKKGPALCYQAYAYTEDADTGRIYFHKKEDKSDRDSFVFLGEVSGIEEEMEAPSITAPERLQELSTIGVPLEEIKKK